MSWRNVIAALVIGAGLGWFGVPSMAQGGNVFKGRLSKVPVDAKMVPVIIGVGEATATLNGSRVTIAAKFEGLGSPATVARLHEAKYRGVHGPVIAELEQEVVRRDLRADLVHVERAGLVDDVGERVGRQRARL